MTLARSHRRARRTALLAVLLASMGGVGCGAKDSDTAEEGDDDEPRGHVTVIAAPTGSDGKTGTLTKIPVGIASAFTESFSLTQVADAYTVQLTSCLSGYSATVTEANTDGLEVYTYDRECLAKLTQFVVGGVTYLPTAGDPFTTWQAGDVATFDESGEPGTAPLRVIIQETLGDPVTGTESIQFGLANLEEGNQRGILWSTVGASAKHLNSGNAEPWFTIRSIELAGQAVSEAGEFRFVLECQSDIGITNDCETVAFADIDYHLVEDTYGSAPTSADCDAIFLDPATTITLPDDRIAPGDAGTTFGGFQTAVLTGPVDLLAKPHMLLVLRSYGASYQYFNVDVTVSASY